MFVCAELKQRFQEQLASLAPSPLPPPLLGGGTSAQPPGAGDVAAPAAVRTELGLPPQPGGGGPSAAARQEGRQAQQGEHGPQAAAGAAGAVDTEEERARARAMRELARLGAWEWDA